MRSVLPCESATGFIALCRAGRDTGNMTVKALWCLEIPNFSCLCFDSVEMIVQAWMAAMCSPFLLWMLWLRKAKKKVSFQGECIQIVNQTKTKHRPPYKTFQHKIRWSLCRVVYSHEYTHTFFFSNGLGRGQQNTKVLPYMWRDTSVIDCCNILEAVLLLPYQWSYLILHWTFSRFYQQHSHKKEPRSLFQLQACSA